MYVKKIFNAMHIVRRCPFKKRFVLFVFCLLLLLHFYLIPIASGGYNNECHMKDVERNNLRFAVQMIGRTMAKHNVTYWLDYGTLLGAVRYKDILPWDSDADISYLLKDEKPSFHKELFDKYRIDSNGLQASYKNKRIDYMRWVPKEGQFEGKDEILLYKYYPKSILKRENIILLHHMKLETFPLSWVKPTKTVNFNGVELAIPNKPHRHLTHRYPFSYKFGVSVPYKWKCWIPCWARKTHGC